MTRAIVAALAIAACAAPATASAATIGIESEVIAYKAKPGEINALRMHGTVGGGFDLRMAFFEHRARLTAGTGCEPGFPVICGAVDVAFPVNVSLGDRSDVANVNSFTQRLSLDAGSGDDDVLAGGIDATAHGGSGSDTIRLAANNATRGSGGSGRDRITGGLGAVAAILDGGSGGDLLVPDGSLFGDAKGGTGADQLVALRGREIRFAGEAGADVLVVAEARGPVSLDGGAGHDIAFAHVGGVNVDAGPGADVIEVQAGPETAPDSVACGPGWDVAWIDEADTVASDCELKLRSAAPTIRRVTSAQTAARALLAHDPDPTTRIARRR